MQGRSFGLNIGAARGVIFFSKSFCHCWTIWDPPDFDGNKKKLKMKKKDKYLLFLGANETLKFKPDALTIIPNIKRSLFVKGSNKKTVETNSQLPFIKKI